MKLFNGIQLLETIFWQILAIISWPISLISGLFSFISEGRSTIQTDLLILLIYPVGMTAFLILITSKRKSWIPVIILHLSLLFSFFFTWKSVFGGYDFMIG